jgi:uncharacterized membrane protein YeiH
MEHTLIYAADLFGTIVFAVTGAIRGISSKLDMLGVIVLACTVGTGGGLLRDALIGATPAAALSNGTYLLICIASALAVLTLPKNIFKRNASIIIYLDAIGLGVFTAIGNAKAAQYALPPITIILSGVITAVGGGAIRDVLLCSIPMILKHDFYATAALIGGGIYLLLAYLNVPFFYQFLLVTLTVILLRILAYRRKVHLPRSGRSRILQYYFRRQKQKSSDS